jgi:putative transposase
VVWCPKYCRKVLDNGVDTRLKEILHQAAQEFRAAGIELEGMPDHVRLLCEVDPQFGNHCLVRYLKGCSFLAAGIHLTAFPPADVVDHTYFVAIVGGAPLAVIKQYIENQKGV